jgi:plastocyanin
VSAADESPGRRRRKSWREGGFVALLALALLAGAAIAAELHRVSQKGRAFSIPAIEIAAGDTIRFANEDDFLHQIYVRSDRFSFESAEQPPGEVVDLRFPVAGTFAVQCEIHPKMHLDVTVR